METLDLIDGLGCINTHTPNKSVQFLSILISVLVRVEPGPRTSWLTSHCSRHNHEDLKGFRYIFLVKFHWFLLNSSNKTQKRHKWENAVYCHQSPITYNRHYTSQELGNGSYNLLNLLTILHRLTLHNALQVFAYGIISKHWIHFSLKYKVKA